MKKCSAVFLLKENNEWKKEMHMRKVAVIEEEKDSHAQNKTNVPPQLDRAFAYKVFLLGTSIKKVVLGSTTGKTRIKLVMWENPEEVRLRPAILRDYPCTLLGVPVN